MPYKDTTDSMGEAGEEAERKRILTEPVLKYLACVAATFVLAGRIPIEEMAEVEDKRDSQWVELETEAEKDTANAIVRATFGAWL